MKKPRYRSAYFYDECWRANIYLVWNIDHAGVTEFCKKTFGLTYENKDPFSGRALEILDTENTGVGHVIAINKWRFDGSQTACLAHECLHVASQILAQRGVKFGSETEETYAYLVDSLVRRCLAVLPK